MNIIEGLNIQGFQLDVAENFNSIPGLKTWIDGRYRIQADGSDRISFIGDLSPELNNFTQSADNRKHTWEDDKWIKALAVSAPETVNARSPRRDFKFLHDGTPFGVYFILNFESNSGTGANYYPLITGGNTETGIQILIAVTGVLQVNVRNAGTSVRSIQIGSLYTGGHANELTLPGTYEVSHVFKGANISNNQIIRIGTLINTTTDTSILSEYAAGEAPFFNILQSNNTTKFLKGGLLLIYDWTGATPTEIDAYDVRVRALLNSIKPEFT